MGPAGPRRRTAGLGHRRRAGGAGGLLQPRLPGADRGGPGLGALPVLQPAPAPAGSGAAAPGPRRPGGGPRRAGHLPGRQGRPPLRPAARAAGGLRPLPSAGAGLPLPAGAGNLHPEPGGRRARGSGLGRAPDGRPRRPNPVQPSGGAQRGGGRRRGPPGGRRRRAAGELPLRPVPRLPALPQRRAHPRTAAAAQPGPRPRHGGLRRRALQPDRPCRPLVGGAQRRGLPPLRRLPARCPHGLPIPDLLADLHGRLAAAPRRRLWG